MRHSHIKPVNIAESINLTPLIDMVFILLIFFLVSASFNKESGITIDRPTAQTTVRQELGNTLIVVTDNNEVWINDQRVDVYSIRGYIEEQHAQNPEGTFIILADQNALVGITVEVLDQIRLAGVSNIAIAAQKE